MAKLQGSGTYITFQKPYLVKVADLIEGGKPIAFIEKSKTVKKVIDKKDNDIKLFLNAVKNKKATDIPKILKDGKDFAPIFSGFKWTDIDKSQFTGSGNVSKTAVGRRPYYGILDVIDLKNYDITEIKKICTFTNKFPTVKEDSDIKAVSDFNKSLNEIIKNNTQGIDIVIDGKRFKNIIGCIPVTVRGGLGQEPKADAVFVQNDNSKLIPVGFFSYKMGKTAQGFQSYSGLSEKSSTSIFNHPETIDFYKTLYIAQKKNKNVFRSQAPYRKFPDNWKTDETLKSIIGSSMWGMEFDKTTRGIDNCEFVLQGDVTMTKGGKFVSISYDHIISNGDYASIKDDYVPIYAGRNTSNRNNKGPVEGKKRYDVSNLRLGIFPLAYMSSRTKIEV